MAVADPPDTCDLGTESADSHEVPGPPPAVRASRGLGSRRRQIVAFAVILGALVFLIVRGLGNATVYFKTADEAVAQRAQLGSHRFRIEGTVQPGVAQVGQEVKFLIANNGATVSVIHSGGASQLFRPGIPVVLEGHFLADGRFASDLIMVKHAASYDAKYPERVTTVPAPTPSPTPGQ